MRHGETQPGSSSGENKIMQGWSKNDITEKGRGEVAMAGRKLASLGNVARVIGSDLPRSATSASIVADKVGVKPETSPNLKPWNIGKLAGKKIRDIKDELDYYHKNVNATPPGGESYASFYGRWAKGLKEYMADAEKNPDSVTAVMTHSRNLLALPSVLKDSGPENVPILGTPATGSISQLTKKGGTWKFNPGAGGEG